ncbi:MAG: DUF58 domain-containing protein [Lachnospiraceae bacterium]|nr:DUF58 domain-containing protein [Lachnospiraceae bacterium]
MPVIIIPIIVGLLIYLQKWVYERFWSRNLDAEAAFRDHTLSAGCETEITERMTNAKILPLPWVQMKFEILRNGKTDNLFRAELFNILFHQQIVRKSKITLEKRGIYQISQVSLFSSDLFISGKLYKHYPNRTSVTVFPQKLPESDLDVPYEKLTGDIATRRYTLEDPFLFKGIRQYQQGDSFKNINFKASARSGEWLVNTHEYTLDQKVRILLLADRSFLYAEEQEYEAALSYAATLTGRLEEEGVPVILESNALDALENKQPFVPEGCSQNHTDAVLEALARLDLTRTGEKGQDMIRRLIDQRSADEYYVIICPEHSKVLMEAYQELAEYTTACMYIAPVTYRAITAMKEEEARLEKSVPNFFYYKL